MNAGQNGKVFTFAGFSLDARQRLLFGSQGEVIPLTERAFDTLLCLLEHAGELVDKPTLMKAVWPNVIVEENNLNQSISILRRALGEVPGEHRFIVTVPGRGFRFVALVQRVNALPEWPTSPRERVADSDQKSAPPAGASPSGEFRAADGRFRPDMTPSATFGRGKGVLWVYGVAATASMAALGLAAHLYLHGPPKLTDKDTIVLADFANSTHDPVFDDTLRQGLAVQLEQSPFLSLISDDRIQQTLKLMGRTADARLSPAVSREVCERTASAAVLDGSIASLGSQYVLTLRAKDCRSGNVLDQEQLQVARKEDVLNALSQIASRFRTRIGESLSTLRSHDKPLAEATTPSLEALRAYSSGWQVSFSSGSAAAVPWFRRATEIDPNFAAAYAALGRMYGDVGESALSAENTSKAYQLRDRASDQEKFFVSVSYDLQVSGNLEKARQTCELWAQTYPRAWFPHSLSAGGIYTVLGRYEKSIEEAEIAIASDPDFSIGYSIIATNYLALGRTNEADNALRRAFARKLDIPDFHVQRYVIAFLEDDRRGMEREAAQSPKGSDAGDWIANAEGLVAAYSGHLEDARKMSQRAVDLARASGSIEAEALYEADAAVREALFGNVSTARQRSQRALMLSRSRDVESGVGFALALTGESPQSQMIADDLARRFPEDTLVQFLYLPTLQALQALNRSQPTNAIELLRTASPYELGTPMTGGSQALLGTGALHPTYVRGLAYLAARQGREAAAEFQKILGHRGIVIGDPIGALAHLQIARAYVLSGDPSKAKSAYNDFASLWRDADPDIPVLQQAKDERVELQ